MSSINFHDQMCSFCETSFSDPNDFINHIKKACTLEDKPVEEEKSSTVTLKRSLFQNNDKENLSKKPKLDCPHCSRTFTRQIELTKHLQSHKTEISFHCRICNEKFMKPLDLNNHWSSAHGVKYLPQMVTFECVYCKKRSKSIIDVADHVHEQNKTLVQETDMHLKCNYCSLKFDFRSDLISHKKSHFQFTKYTCNFCPAKFDFVSEVRRHEDTHIQSHEFQCKVCTKQTWTALKLEQHLKMMHKVIFLPDRKTYQCVCCEKMLELIQIPEHVKKHIHTESKTPTVHSSNASPTTMRQRHAEIHQKCKLCNEMFQNFENLKLHLNSVHQMRIRTDLKGLECVKCEKKFYRKGLHIMIDHIKEHAVSDSATVVENIKCSTGQRISSSVESNSENSPKYFGKSMPKQSPEKIENIKRSTRLLKSINYVSESPEKVENHTQLTKATNPACDESDPDYSPEKLKNNSASPSNSNSRSSENTRWSTRLQKSISYVSESPEKVENLTQSTKATNPACDESDPENSPGKLENHSASPSNSRSSENTRWSTRLKKTISYVSESPEKVENPTQPTRATNPACDESDPDYSPEKLENQSASPSNSNSRSSENTRCSTRLQKLISYVYESPEKVENPTQSTTATNPACDESYPDYSPEKSENHSARPVRSSDVESDSNSRSSDSRPRSSNSKSRSSDSKSRILCSRLSDSDLRSLDSGSLDSDSRSSDSDSRSSDSDYSPEKLENIRHSTRLTRSGRLQNSTDFKAESDHSAETKISKDELCSIRPKKSATDIEEEQRLKCSYCQKYFDEKSDLERHLNEHKNDRSFTCKICNSRVEEYSRLSNHLEEIHQVIFERAKGVYVCIKCETELHSSNELIEHLKKHDAKESEPMVEVKNIDNLRMPKSFNCKFCSTTFAFKSLLQKHESSHSNEKPFHCQLCTRNFKLSFHINQHLKNNHQILRTDNAYKCMKCEMESNLINNMTEHMKVHICDMKEEMPLSMLLTQKSEKKPTFKCKLCPQTFRYKSDLERHGYTHSKEKGIQCELCKRSFKHPSELHIHLKSHHIRGTRSKFAHKCMYCEMESNSLYDIAEHMKVHGIDAKAELRDLSVSCPICDKKLKNSYCIPLHLKAMHQIEFNRRRKICECINCDIELSSPFEMAEHLKDHGLDVDQERLTLITILYKKIARNQS